MGAVTDIGLDAPTTWASLKEGRSGICPITAFEQDEDWSTRFAGEIQNFDASSVADVREAKRMDRVSLLALVAAEEAVSYTHLTLPTILRV